MYSQFRYPGEFENRSDVFVTWLPPYIGAGEFDSRKPCAEIVKALVDQVQVHVNCGQPGCLEDAQNYLQKAGVDLSKIKWDCGRFLVHPTAPDSPARRGARRA